MKSKIYLRKMQSKDANILYPLTSDKESGKYMKSGAHTSLSQTQKMVDEYCKENNLAYIVETEKKETVGYIVLANKEEIYHSLSLMTFPQFRNKGYSSIATKLIIEEAKKSDKVKGIISYVVNQNIGSCRIMEKCNFVLKDVLHVSDDEIVNVYFLKI